MAADSTTPGCAGRVLGLFAKRPLAGLVKTRLAADSSPGFAARVAAAFLFDLVQRWSGFDAQRILAYTPADEQAYFAQLAGDRFALMSQGEGDLGQRMTHFFSQLFRSGAEKVVLLGTDSPTIPTWFIEQAFEELARADVVLGPATDGGYYLVGCASRPGCAGRPDTPVRSELPPIFDGIPWGGSRVLLETVTRLASSGRRLALLPPWYDVDTLDDWWMLQGHLEALCQAGIDPGLPQTTAVKSEW